MADGHTTAPAAAGGADRTADAGPALQAAVDVMDRLRSDDGCPWDRDQTHRSLVRYLIEECYELVEAIENDDSAGMREELGDVLLQVLFHARIAAERRPDEGGFTITDVADGLVTKLVRRHPYVFGGPEEREQLTADEQQRRWDELKKTEDDRSTPLAGVALGQPAIALAAKLGSRAKKYGVPISLPTGESVGEQIFRLAFAAGAAGDDPEAAVRDVARAVAAQLAEPPTDAR